MAYRQLCALSFAVLGLVSVACGGSTTSLADTTSSSSPPSDKPPGSSDQPPAPNDQPPGSVDSPPASADAPAGSGSGGKLGQLCQEFCSSIVGVVDRCSGGMQSLGKEVCSGSNTCQVPANLPCQNEFVDFFNCFIDQVDALCPADKGNNGNGNDAQPANLCSDAMNALSSCAEKNGLDMQSMSTDQPKGCFASGGCDCPNDCAKCTCQAGSNATAIAACAQPGAACNR